MADEVVNRVSYYETLHFTDQETGEEFDVVLTSPDADRVRADPVYAQVVYDAHQAVVRGLRDQQATSTSAEPIQGTSAEALQGTSAEARQGTSAEARQGTSAEARQGTSAEARQGTSAEPIRTSTEPIQGQDKTGGKVLWPSDATFALIYSWTDHKDDRESSTVKMTEVWTKIRDDLNTTHGFSYTRDQCSAKWRGLKQHYMRLKDSSKKTGRGKMPHWTYYQAMDDALAGDPAVTPVGLLESGMDMPQVSPEKMPQKSPQKTPRKTPVKTPARRPPTPKRLNTPPRLTKSTQKKKAARSANAEQIRELSHEQERRHQEKLIELRRKNALLAELVEAIKK